MKNIQKRYIILSIVILGVLILIWQLRSSYALVNIGYDGKNIVSGDKWGVNIVEVSDIETKGEAIVTREVSTIGTTLNFDVSLFKPGDEVSFNITTENTSNLNAELYALTLAGVSPLDAEVITYVISPLDYVSLHEETKDGSIIKKGEKQMFNIKVIYDQNVSINNNKEYNLSLGSTIIYKQK